MSEIHKSLTHIFVHVDGVCVSHKLPHHLTLLILHHQDLLRLGHPANHQRSYLWKEDKEHERWSVLLWSESVAFHVYLSTLSQHTFQKHTNTHVKTRWLRAYLGEDCLVELSSWVWSGKVERWGAGGRQERRLSVQVGCKGIPILKADLEYLCVIHFRDQDQVLQSLKVSKVKVTWWGTRMKIKFFILNKCFYIA